MNDDRKKIQSSLAGPLWEKIGIYPHHGITLPLSALRSKNSCGIGEFLDLIPVIDWCKRTKFDVIQLLPLNDSGSDSSPYNALSSCALNPIYLSLYAMPLLDEFPDLKKKLPEIQELSLSQRISFHDVQSRKLKWLRDYFEKMAPNLIKVRAFFDFVSNNAWVKEYALFKAIKDRLGQNSWATWPKELKDLTQKAFDSLMDEYWSDVSFYIAMQFFCYQQYEQIKKHAVENQVFIKGDIPILISPDSADVWAHTDFFDLSLAAGAPPDAYNKKGQYWGFPLYKWDVKKKTQYKWWKQRLSCASNCFDIYRIDHVVGFFRIWAIPLGKLPIEGHYIPENESLWLSQGKELLEMLLSSSNMLPIAEDLGVVPPFVRPCLSELGICGTRVMRWERKWDEDGKVIPLEDYPALSLTCISTHDSETLQIWWKNYPDEAKPFAEFKKWEYTPDLSIQQRKELLWDSHHTSSLFHINLLQEYFAMFPELTWTNPEDERINVPGELLPTNWTYRFRPSVEEFTKHEALETALQKILFSPNPSAI